MHDMRRNVGGRKWWACCARSVRMRASVKAFGMGGGRGAWTQTFDLCAGRKMCMCVCVVVMAYGRETRWNAFRSLKTHINRNSHTQTPTNAHTHAHIRVHIFIVSFACAQRLRPEVCGVGVRYLVVYFARTQKENVCVGVRVHVCDTLAPHGWLSGQRRKVCV